MRAEPRIRGSDGGVARRILSRCTLVGLEIHTARRSPARRSDTWWQGHPEARHRAGQHQGRARIASPLSPLAFVSAPTTERGSGTRRSLSPFPARTMISPRMKSMSFTRRETASPTRSPLPYIRTAQSRGTPLSFSRILRTSSGASTTGSFREVFE